MEINKDSVDEIIKESIEEMNTQLEEGKRLKTDDENDVIFGPDSPLDSLDFVNLMVIIEDTLFDKTGRDLTIVSDRAFSKKYNPFKNIERLSQYILELLKEED